MKGKYNYPAPKSSNKQPKDYGMTGVQKNGPAPSNNMQTHAPRSAKSVRSEAFK